MDAYHIPTGQQQARTRWGTHESGAAFDKKKTTHLTEQAQSFLAQGSIHDSWTSTTDSLRYAAKVFTAWSYSYCSCAFSSTSLVVAHTRK